MRIEHIMYECSLSFSLYRRKLTVPTSSLPNRFIALCVFTFSFFLLCIVLFQFCLAVIVVSYACCEKWTFPLWNNFDCLDSRLIWEQSGCFSIVFVCFRLFPTVSNCFSVVKSAVHPLEFNFSSFSPTIWKMCENTWNL